MSVNAMATDAGRSMIEADCNGSRNDPDRRREQIRLVALVATVLALGLAYAPNFYSLSAIWLVDPNYSHGFLVIPIALVILWKRLTAPELEPLPSAIARPWLGWCLLTAVLALRAFAYEGNYNWLETATVLPAIVCLVWIFGGGPLLKRVWPAVAFLVFMLPLPEVINNRIALPLQQFAAAGSAFLLQLSGLWAIQEGNVINLTTANGGMSHLDVAAACNGLKMLMTLTATITATIILVPLPTWKRIVLLVSVVPIALISNMTRIVATGWCYHIFEGERGRQLAHDWSGYLMMPLALLLVGLELGILSWLVPSEEELDDDDRKSLVNLMNEKSRGIIIPKSEKSRGTVPKKGQRIVPKKGRDPEV